MKTVLLGLRLPTRIFHAWREISALSFEFAQGRRASTPALRACAQDYARVSLEQGAKHRVETGIVLAMLALAACPQRWSVATAGAVVPVGVAANPSRHPGESGPEIRDDKPSPTNQFLTAYNSMSTADWLKEKGMRAEATDLYTEALNLFLKITADYPQWQPAVVSFRVNYCRTALNDLQGPGAEDRRRQTTDDGRPTAENQKPGSAGALPAPPEHYAGASRPSESKSEISNLSPLNFKLQQAALKERGRDYTGALAMYIALLEEYPQEPWALKGACRCCLRLGRMDQARALTRQALTLPPDADLNLLAALVACHDGRYQTAIPLLRQSLKQNGACPEAHVALGVALTATGEIKEAQEEMKRALSLNPKLGDAFYNLARLSLRQKPTDHDTPRVHYQNALRHGATPDPELDKLLAE